MSVDAGFPAIVHQVLSERGTIITRNLRVFNSLLADYCGCEWQNERRAFVAALQNGKSLDAALEQVCPPPKYSAPAAVVPAPVPAEGRDVKIRRWLEKGVLHLQLEEPEEADNYFRKVLDMDSQCADAWYCHACAESQLHHLHQAVNSLETALEYFRAENNRDMAAECKKRIADIQERIRDDAKYTDDLIKGGVELAMNFFDLLK